MFDLERRLEVRAAPKALRLRPAPLQITFSTWSMTQRREQCRREQNAFTALGDFGGTSDGCVGTGLRVYLEGRRLGLVHRLEELFGFVNQYA